MKPEAPVFASTYPYAACKGMGELVYKRWEAEQIASAESLDASPMQGFRTLGQLSRVCPFQLFSDASTYITRARSVTSGHFLRSDKDVWFSVDDDIETDARVLRDLILACRATREAVAVPYFNRDGRSATFTRIYGPTEWLEPDRIPVRRVAAIGMGCVAVHRDLIERLAPIVPWFRESNKGDQRAEPDCPALFREDVQDGLWIGEDYYFSALCERAGAPVRVLLDAVITHQQWKSKLGLDGIMYLMGTAPEPPQPTDSCV